MRKTQAQHTRGQWEYESAVDDFGRDCIAITAPSRPGYIAGIHCSEGVSLDDIDEANARLIAAAPELLEALEELTFRAHVAMGLPIPCNSLPETPLGNAIKAAGAAIAKAEGRI